MTPYYSETGVTIYHGDCLDVLADLDPDDFGALVTDPPYGIAYKSNQRRHLLADSIVGDEDTSLRDAVLDWWGDRPALVFGTWRVARPLQTRALLVWDTKGALGMGDTSLPWKPSHQEIYVLGRGFTGHRGTDVLTYAPVQSMARNGRVHPHEKPVDLMRDLVGKCARWPILDPFMGSGSTLRAAKDLGVPAVGIEVERRYVDIAVQRLAQEVLPLGGAA